MDDLGYDIDTTILDSLHGGVYIVDKNRKIVFWNKLAEVITGFSSKEVVGKHCRDSVLTHIDEDGNELCTGLCPLLPSLKNGEATEREMFLHHKAGQRVPVSVRTNALEDDEGNVIGAIELFSDISNIQEYKQKIEELEKLALLDNLTQLPNRNYLEKELSLCFEERRRYNIDFGLFFIDIDLFKMFNDTYGHNVGDEVLKFISKTFMHNARPFDIYGRWGGEEFIAIIRNVNKASLENIGNRIRLLVANSYILHNKERLKVTISVGGSIVTGSDDIDSLIKRADELMYLSKAEGRNKVTIG